MKSVVISYEVLYDSGEEYEDNFIVKDAFDHDEAAESFWVNVLFNKKLALSQATKIEITRFIDN